MNATNENTVLPSDVMRLLGIYSNLKQNKPVNMTIEDIDQLKELMVSIPTLEEASKTILDEIQVLQTEIEERKQKIDELHSQIDPRIQYLNKIPSIVSPKIVTRTTNGNNPINKTAVLEVLRIHPKSGNKAICEHLSIIPDKANTNKAYSIAKSLMHDGLLSEDRTVL